MERKDYMLIKLTKEEKETIKKKAQENGMTISTYVRLTLLRKGKN